MLLFFCEGKDFFAEKASCVRSFNVENFIVDRNGNAFVLAFSHAKRTLKQNFVLKLFVLNKVTERSNYALRTAEMAACSDTDFDLDHYSSPFPLYST